MVEKSVRFITQWASKRGLDVRIVPGIVTLGGAGVTIPELLFDKKGLIPRLQELFGSNQ